MFTSSVARSAAGWVAILALLAGPAGAQNYPVKPIRLQTSEPGGSSDFTARLLATGLTGVLGHQVVVENRPAIVAIEATAKSAPDGYNLLVMSNLLWILPLLQSTSYDAVRDFIPVSLVASSPNILVVHPSLPVRSTRELIDLAKRRPGQINFGTSGTGASNHLAGELFKSMAGIDIVRVNYKGGGPSMLALVSGEVQLSFASAGSVAGHIKANRLRALGVTSAKPSVLVPGVPPIADAVPGYETVAAYGIFAPAGVPAAIVSRLNQESQRVVNAADTRERFLGAGAEPTGTTTERASEMIRAEIASMGKIIRKTAISN